MYEHLKTIKVKKTRKVHECNASIWLSEQLSEIRSGEIRLTISERRAVIRMMRNNWKIPVGSSCEYHVGIYDSDFFATYNDPEIHEICVKYSLYDD
jgi:hypothetical protein